MINDIKIGRNCIFLTNPDGSVLSRCFWGAVVIIVSIVSMTM